MKTESLVQLVAPWCLLALAAATLLCLVRLFLGPSRSDRVVAVDLIAILAAGAMAVLALSAEEPAYSRVALVIALVSFLATVALAFYVRHPDRAKTEEEDRR